MAYAAVISVMHTIQRLFNSSLVWIASSSLEILQSAYSEVESLQQVLKRLDNCISSSKRKRMSALDGEIREAVSKLEDVIESSLSSYFQSQFEESVGDENCSIALFSIDEEEIQSLVETVKKMKEEYAEELYKPSLPEEEDNHAVSSRYTDFGGKKSNIFGLSDDELTKLKHQITESKNYEFRIVSIVGQGSTTRTIFAKLVCEQASRNKGFERCAMVTIGREYQVKDILIALLFQIDQELLIWEERGDEYEKLLGERLYTCLKGRRYFIVLDDIWEIEAWNLLRSSFPKEDYGSRVFLITSLMELAQFANSYIYNLNIEINDEGWGLIWELDPSSYRERRAEVITKIQLILSEGFDEMTEV